MHTQFDLPSNDLVLWSLYDHKAIDTLSMCLVYMMFPSIGSQCSLINCTIIAITLI